VAVEGGPVSVPRFKVSEKPGGRGAPAEHFTALLELAATTVKKVDPHVGVPPKVHPDGAVTVMAVIANALVVGLDTFREKAVAVAPTTTLGMGVTLGGCGFAAKTGARGTATRKVANTRRLRSRPTPASRMYSMRFNTIFARPCGPIFLKL
jgi:hypothetical protein